MNVLVAKTVARISAALFTAFFGTIQLRMTACVPRESWARWLCDNHPITFLLAPFVCLFAVTMLTLSNRYSTLRRPLAVFLLLAYSAYGFVEVFQSRSWLLALVPVSTVAAATGVALKARWGALMTYAISALFLIYWVWGVVTAARVGVFQSRPPLEAALMLIPGICFGLLAGFCSYACRRDTQSNGP